MKNDWRFHETIKGEIRADFVELGKWSDQFLGIGEKVLKKVGEIFKIPLTHAVRCGILCADEA